jgi:hypothetical protein
MFLSPKTSFQFPHKLFYKKKKWYILVLKIYYTGPIIIEIDCMQVVQAIQSKQKNNTEIGAIIDCCRHLISLYENCSISYVQRQTNQVAHDLARASRFIAHLHVLNSCTESTIMNEMN